MDQDKLINSLCDDLCAVKKMRHPFICLSMWLAIAAALIGGMIWYLGLRHDLPEVMNDPFFLFEMALITLLGLASVVNTFWLRIPDMRGAGWMVPIPFVLLFVFALWTLIRMTTGSISMPTMEFHHCMQDGVVIAAVPAALMFFACLHGYTTHPVLMAIMNGLALGAIGYVSLRLTCASEEVGHVLYTHVLPFIVIGSLAGFLARRFYKW